MDLKEVITTLGFDPEKVKTIEDFKTSVDSTFTRNTLINEESEPVKKIIGKTLGGLENHVKKAAKEFGVEVDFNSEAVKSLGLTDKLKLVVSEVDKKNKITIEELEGKVGLGNDEKVKEWEKKYEKVSQKSKDLQSLLDATKTEYQQFQEKAANQIKGKALDVHKKELFAKAKWPTGTNEYTKKGFMDEFVQEYKLDLDESENPVIFNNKGERIPSKKIVGTFMTPYEVWEEKQAKANLFPLNQDGGKPKPTGLNIGQVVDQTQKNTRVIAPRLK